MTRVLFVCRQNAGRSQISEALFRLAADERHEVRSAGTTPAAHVHPEVVEAMREVGVELSDRAPHELDRADAEWADLVVTMGGIPRACRSARYARSVTTSARGSPRSFASSTLDPRPRGGLGTDGARAASLGRSLRARVPAALRGRTR